MVDLYGPASQSCDSEVGTSTKDSGTDGAGGVGNASGNDDNDGISSADDPAVCQRGNGLDGQSLSHHECYSPPSSSSSTSSSSSSSSLVSPTPLALAQAIVTILKDGPRLSPNPSSFSGSSPSPSPSIDSNSSPSPSPGPSPFLPAEISLKATTVKTAHELLATLHSLYQRQQRRQQQQQQLLQQQRNLHDDGTTHDVDGDVDDYHLDVGNGLGVGVRNDDDDDDDDDDVDEGFLLRDVVDPLLAFNNKGSDNDHSYLHKDNDQDQDKDKEKNQGLDKDKDNEKDTEQDTNHDKTLNNNEPTTVAPPLPLSLPHDLASIIPQHHTRWLAGDYPDINMSVFSVEESFELVMRHVRSYPGTR